MATGPRYSVKFRRRREEKTDYKKRLALLKSGKSRAVIRLSNRYAIIQIVQYSQKGDKTLLTVNSNQLKKLGWKHSSKSLPAVYLIGLLAGKLAVDKKIGETVFDIGRKTSTKGGRVYAVLKGLTEAGLSIPHDNSNFPDEDRCSGKHINAEVAKDFEKVKQNVLKAQVVENKEKKKKEAKK